MNEVNATPHTELIAELMNPNNPKNEREHAAVREIERLQEALAQPAKQEPVAHCEAGPEYCWKCNEEIKPTYGSEEIRKLREVNKHLSDHIPDAKKMVEPPPWWTAVENILNEYGLQAIDFVADFKKALAQPQKEKFCDSNCVWTDHHPDCNLTQSEQESVAMADYMALMKKYVALKSAPPQRTWVGLMRGVRVEGETVVITVKGGNDAARELCSELLNEMGVRNGD